MNTEGAVLQTDVELKIGRRKKEIEEEESKPNVVGALEVTGWFQKQQLRIYLGYLLRRLSSVRAHILLKGGWPRRFCMSQ